MTLRTGREREGEGGGDEIVVLRVAGDHRRIVHVGMPFPEPTHLLLERRRLPPV
jgi:hypothetical protein